MKKAPVVTKKIAKAPKAPKVVKARPVGSFAKKPTKKIKRPSFGIYLFKVLKQIHPTLGISKKSMGIMDSLV